jgi:hypothetical protein
MSVLVQYIYIYIEKASLCSSQREESIEIVSNGRRRE